MKPPLEDNLRPDMRRIRATQITHLLIHVLRDFIPYECLERASNEVYKVLHDHGAEMITDQTRAEAGLPPRGPDGWTVEELQALEYKRLETFLRPIAPVFVKTKDENTKLEGEQ